MWNPCGSCVHRATKAPQPTQVRNIAPNGCTSAWSNSASAAVTVANLPPADAVSGDLQSLARQRQLVSDGEGPQVSKFHWRRRRLGPGPALPSFSYSWSAFPAHRVKNQTRAFMNGQSRMRQERAEQTPSAATCNRWQGNVNLSVIHWWRWRLGHGPALPSCSDSWTAFPAHRVKHQTRACISEQSRLRQNMHTRRPA